MVVTMGQQYIVEEKPTVIMYTYINRHAGPPNKTKLKKGVVIIYDNSAVEPCFASFSSFLLSLKPLPFVQSFFILRYCCMHEPRQAHALT